MMKPKTQPGKSPRRPVTKEVFPYEMERKKTTGTLHHKPYSQGGMRKKKSESNDNPSNGLTAKGTTVKSTPKSTLTKKAGLKAKENMSTNQLRNRPHSKTTKKVKRSPEKSVATQRIAAIAIQRWWKNILEEREGLRRKLLAAREALQQLKRKSQKSSSIASESPAKVSQQDLSIDNMNSPSNKNIIEIQKSEEKKENEGLQTACFGQFNLQKEDVYEQSEEKTFNLSESKDYKTDSDIDQITEALNIKTNKNPSNFKEEDKEDDEDQSQTDESQDGAKTNKLEQLAKMLKSNPDMIDIIDSDDDSKIEAFMNKILPDDESEKQEESKHSDPEDEDSEQLKKEADHKQEHEEVAQNSPKHKDESEPTEKSFSEYSGPNEKKLKSVNSPEKDAYRPVIKESSYSPPSKHSNSNHASPYKADLDSKSDVIVEEASHLEDTTEVRHETNEKTAYPDTTPSRSLRPSRSGTKSKEFSEVSYKQSELSNSPHKEVPDKQKDEGKLEKLEKSSQLMSFLDNLENESTHNAYAIDQNAGSNYRSPSKAPGGSQFLHTLTEGLGIGSNTDLKSQVVSLEIELKECYHTIEALKEVRMRQDKALADQKQELQAEMKDKLALQKQEYEIQRQRDLEFIDQLIADKKLLSDKLEELTNSKVDCDAVMSRREKEIKQRYEIELKKNKEMWMAGEKLKREKWMKEKTEEIRELSAKGLEPTIDKMIKKHKDQLKQSKEKYYEKLNDEKLKLAQEYEEKYTDFKAKTTRDREEAVEKERERYETKIQQQYERIEAQFNKERERWSDNMKTETERIESFRKRDADMHTDEIRALKKQHQDEMLSLKRFYEDKMDKSQFSHKDELNELKTKLKEEYDELVSDQEQKQKDVLREKLKEMRDQVKRERNEEINVIVNKLSSEAFDTEKALIAKFDRKERELEAKYRSEIMELKEHLETVKDRSDAERRTKEMLEENLDITSKRLNENDNEINEKNQMIENLRGSVKLLTEKLNSIQANEEQERARFERDEISKRSSMEREIILLQEEIEKQKQNTDIECNKLRREHKYEIEVIEDKVKKAIARKNDDINVMGAKIAKLQELLSKQRSDLLK